MHPETIGPYQIHRKIGAGGMGNVYFGVHVENGQEAAIKVLPPSLAREDGFVQRFSREIAALRQLSNPHIVRLFEDGAANDTYWYAMEYVDGVTLTAEISERHRIPWREVVSLTLQIAAALKAAHDAGIVHRDLKPSNLMLTKDGQVKLTDFGVAHVFATTRLTRSGGIVGTAEYMSPEQAAGKRATKRSDLYSLGAVMYAMLTGRPPFTGQTVNDILQKHQYGQFDKPTRYVPELPRLLEEFVCQLLEKDPSRRVPDALVLIRRLEQLRSRIDFAEQQSETATIERPAPGATVQAAGGGSPDNARIPFGPGPATLIRDLLREEATSSLRKSPLARFFDNTYVLVLLLVLIVAGGVYFQGGQPSDPQKEIDRARSILESPPGPAWLRARDEILHPLANTDLLLDQRIEVQRLTARADQYEFSRSLNASSTSNGSAESELHRLIRRTFELHASGNPDEAEKQLRSILAMLAADQTHDYLKSFLSDSLQHWSRGDDVAGRSELIGRILENASEAERTGNPDRARIALQGAVDLYGQDPSLAPLIEECRQRLARLPAANRQDADPLEDADLLQHAEGSAADSPDAGAGETAATEVRECL